MNNNTKETHNWLAGLLTGWGIKECWAKVIAGAIVGALAALGLLTGCSGKYTQNAAGDVQADWVLVLPVKEGK